MPHHRRSTPHSAVSMGADVHAPLLDLPSSETPVVRGCVSSAPELGAPHVQGTHAAGGGSDNGLRSAAATPCRAHTLRKRVLQADDSAGQLQRQVIRARRRHTSPGSRKHWRQHRKPLTAEKWRAPRDRLTPRKWPTRARSQGPRPSVGKHSRPHQQRARRPLPTPVSRRCSGGSLSAPGMPTGLGHDGPPPAPYRYVPTTIDVFLFTLRPIGRGSGKERR